MKTFYTSSDIGSVLVGTKDFGVAMNNGFGDGETTVLIFDSNVEFARSEYEKTAHFTTSIEGEFNIYNYDCSHREEADVIHKLSGRYGVYRYTDWHGGTVIFVKWE